MGALGDIHEYLNKSNKNKKSKSVLELSSNFDKKNSKSENSFGIKPLTSSKNMFSTQKTEKSRDVRRTFTQSQRKEILYQQNNRCAGEHCNHSPLDPRAIEFDHIKPWADNGRTIIENGRALCPTCHKIETHKTQLKKADKKRIVKKDPYELPKLKW